MSAQLENCSPRTVSVWMWAVYCWNPVNAWRLKESTPANVSPLEIYHSCAIVQWRKLGSLVKRGSGTTVSNAAGAELGPGEHAEILTCRTSGGNHGRLSRNADAERIWSKHRMLMLTKRCRRLRGKKVWQDNENVDRVRGSSLESSMMLSTTSTGRVVLVGIVR